MGPAETPGNGIETVSDTELALLRIEAHLERIDAQHRERAAELERKLDHVDEQIHGLVRLIDEHKPLLAQAAALADPGAKVRAMLHPKKAKSDG